MWLGLGLKVRLGRLKVTGLVSGYWLGRVGLEVWFSVVCSLFSVFCFLLDVRSFIRSLATCETRVTRRCGQYWLLYSRVSIEALF